MDMVNSHGWGMGGGMFFLSVLFWVLVALGVFFLAKGLLGQKRPEKGDAEGESPMAILRKRYASGEIDHDTFEQMKKDLEQ